MEMEPLFITFMLLSYLAAQNLVGGTNYTVGDEEGWTYGLDYQTWGQQHNFTVGDALIFSYIKGQHNVYEVAEDTFRTCDARSGVFSTYDSGNDVFNLTRAGNYWFLCNAKGHCRGGMRFGITVASASPGGDSGGGGGDGGGGGETPYFPAFGPPPSPFRVNGASEAAGVESLRRWLAAVFGFSALINCVIWSNQLTWSAVFVDFN